MKLITKDHLEQWANTAVAKSEFPHLISRLIRATTPSSTKVNISSGSATYLKGWDGIVECEEERAFVPQGISLWEFGTSSSCTKKANDDYNKREKDSLGFSPKDSIFIFVTPRFWSQKDKWIAKKKAENHWKDVKAYDSIDIEQWLDNTLSVSRWFAVQINVYPYDGILTADEFWEEWSIGPNNLNLLPECIVAGREKQKDLLLGILQDKPTIKGIKASTKDEAIAFIIASAKLFPKDECERFFSKSLIVDTEENYRGIRINNDALNLIPKFDNTQPLYSAVSKGHHVLVPLGAADDFNQETITLNTIDRDKLIESLITSGINKDNAEKYARESGRNITILKKLLGFPHKTEWIYKEDIREIIPILILGKWDETHEGDIELIEKLSGQKYEDFLITLNKWKNSKESPIIQIGNIWRLTSPLDIWNSIAPKLILKDFNDLKECFLLVFKHCDPTIKPNNIIQFSEKHKYSDLAREGLTQSLIMIGHVKGLNIPSSINPQVWVDNIVSELLNNASGELWISIEHELPLISEASPESFIKAIKKSLEKEHPEIMDMFQENDEILLHRNHHTGLLWALEGLAWLPEHLLDASMVLLKLSRLVTNESSKNRPLNSLSEIFKPWHYQTLASYKERIDILKYITAKEKAYGWMLLINLLPQSYSTAFQTHKMRWRSFEKNTNINYTYQEIWDTHSEIIEILISIYDNDEEKFSQLLKNSTNLTYKDRKRVLDWANTIYKNTKQEKYYAWNTIREILSHHRTHSDEKWALPESELIKYEELYNKLQPIDVVNKYIWLFNEFDPEFPKGFKYNYNNLDKSFNQRQQHLSEARINSVKCFIQELGLKKTLELRKHIKMFGIYGQTIAEVITQHNDVITVCECLNDDINHIDFIRQFIYRKSIIEKFDWIKLLFKELQENGFNNKALSNILIPINQNQQIWDYVATLNKEIQNEYWQNIIPNFYYTTTEEKVYGINILLKYKRYCSTIKISSLFSKEIPSTLLIETLDKVAIEDSNENCNFDAYNIQQIIAELETRTDIDKFDIIRLEWQFFPFLNFNSNTRPPCNLENELATNPDFFISVLKCVYPSKNESLSEKRYNIISKNRAIGAYHLFNSWKKIPGIKKDNSIDEKKLNDWIIKVRNLAKKSDRLEFADLEIGKVLAQCPENCKELDQEKIYKIIEEINTDHLKDGYSVALQNKNNLSIRGVFDGGNIERTKAEYYENLVKLYRNKYPNVAEIFHKIQMDYLTVATFMDEKAERLKLEN